MQYIDTAIKLATHVLRYSCRIPKRYGQKLANPLVNHATEVLYHVQCANRIYVKSDSDFEQRRNHLHDARGELDHVAALLDIAYAIEEKPNQNVYLELAEKIDKERALIQGVMEKDRNVWMVEGKAGS